MIKPYGVAMVKSDNAVMFKSERMQRMRIENEVDSILTVAYRHQANPVEKRIQTMKTILKDKLLNGMQLRKALQTTKNEMNNILVCDSTGKTPYEMKYGFPYESAMDRKIKSFYETKKKDQEEDR